MAEGGYDVEAVGEVSKDLCCIICLRLMKDAIQMKCGHGMCNFCFQQLVKASRNTPLICPSCKEDIHEDEIVPVPMINRIISDLKVKCQNHNHGCTWVGDLSNMEEHTSLHCLYESVACFFPECSSIVFRSALQHHQQICKYRLVPCDYCQEQCTFKDVANHLLQCQLYPVLCKNNDCTVMVPRNKIMDHQLSCMYLEIECSYNSFGCHSKMPRKDLDEHLKQATSEHLLLITNEQAVTKMKYTSLEGSNELLQKELGEMKIYCKTLEEKVTQVAADKYQKRNELGSSVFLEQLGLNWEKLIIEDIEKVLQTEIKLVEGKINESVNDVRSRISNSQEYAVAFCVLNNLNAVNKQIWEKEIEVAIENLQEEFERFAKRDLKEEVIKACLQLQCGIKTSPSWDEYCIELRPRIEAYVYNQTVSAIFHMKKFVEKTSRDLEYFIIQTENSFSSVVADVPKTNLCKVHINSNDIYYKACKTSMITERANLLAKSPKTVYIQKIMNTICFHQPDDMNRCSDRKFVSVHIVKCLDDLKISKICADFDQVGQVRRCSNQSLSSFYSDRNPTPGEKSQCVFSFSSTIDELIDLGYIVNDIFVLALS